MHYPTIESNRRFLLKNRSKSIVHLKAGIVTALEIQECDHCFRKLEVFKKNAVIQFLQPRVAANWHEVVGGN